MKSYKSIFIGALLLLTFLLATMSTWIYSKINDALPLLSGKETVFGLSTTVTIDRDKLGIPTIKAKNRNDAALATGFIHAQERFFQMDLLRRNSAGELSSLFGEVAFEYDKSVRRHRFRDRARTIIQQLPVNEYELLKAYTRGVNQGLDYLRSNPFEYLLLQQDPVAWQEEDSILAVFSMYIDLQYHDGKRERTLGVIKDLLGENVFNFLNPKGSQWDAALDGSQFEASNIPQQAWPSASALSANLTSKAAPTATLLNNIEQSAHPFSAEQTQTEYLPGSNNWAVSGQISSTKSAIVANDMHLGIRVPNTWFRASIEYQSNNHPVKITGLTLPGTPNIVTGSNGSIAWGFTNSYGDWSDIIVLETNEDKSQYKTPDGFIPFTNELQMVAIKDQSSVEITIQETIWGPVIGEDHHGNLLAYRWVAHDKEAVNFTSIRLETANSVDEAFAIAAVTGIPAQNFMVGDHAGNIGWTIMGAIPRKKGQVGDTPQNWSDGTNGWHGYLTASEYPKVFNPDSHRLWTANSRVVGGEMYKKLGNGGYALGARSSQIKDNLFAVETFNEEKLLAIALDNKAQFLKRWQQFLLDTVLTEQALSTHKHWQEVKSTLDENELKADTTSVAYRLVRNFRLNLRDYLFEPLVDNLTKHDQQFSFRTIRHQIETPLWQLVTQQPDNFLMLPEQNWQKVFQVALDKTLNEMTANQPLAKATWGQQNTANIQHPLSKAVPFIGQWLDMPATELPGDSYMPRVQGTTFGASERMIISPGHEESGILHMPTSQSGHPWSPYYGAGHKDWEQGKPSPFLPGETIYTLTLHGY